MPELPEVETIRRILEEEIVGKTIDEVVVLRPDNVKGDVDEFRASLKGATFTGMSRKGKFLIFHLSIPKVLVAHLRMEGKYFLGKRDDPFEKHDILAYEFSDGSRLRYNDVRKFGEVRMLDARDYLLVPPLSEVGPEPFEASPEYLFAALRKKKGDLIKEALLDQRMLAGLGNIYVDEVLFASKINPKRPANSITQEEAESLIGESRRILALAIANKGSTIRSYHPKEGVSGKMQDSLLAYGHGNEPCPRCGTIMRKIAIGGRGTVYCPHCQAMPGRPFLVGVTGPIASGKSTVAKYLAAKGYEVVDADEIVASIYEDPSFLIEFQDAFGPSLVKEGHIIRPALLHLLKEDSKAKKALEDMVHPLVYKKMKERYESSAAKKMAFDVPLLINSPLEAMCDLIITISADAEIRAKRIEKRGKNPSESLKLNEKWPLSAAKRVSGVLLDGNGNEDSLVKQLDEISCL